MQFSSIEISEIVKSWFIISLAFAILLSDNLLNADDFFVSFVIAGFTVGLGFLLHELAHKMITQRYGCNAEYRSFNAMLILALVMSFFGFIFAAPGAVMIQGYLDVRKNGIVSLFGPLTNFVLGLIFIIIMFLTNFQSEFLSNLLLYGYIINVWLGLFNLLPFWNIDGSKILAWNKLTYGLLVVFGLLLFFIGSSV